jgi:hypothetical protein
MPHFPTGGVYLKISELISLTGSAGGIPLEPPFRPPRLEAEAKRTISSFSLTAILKINPDISKSKSFFFTLSKPIRNINTYCHHLDNNYWDNN